jgi:hypothetical protein
MFLSKEKLAIQVTQIYCIKVYDVNFSESAEKEVLEKLASNTSGTDKQHARLFKDEREKRFQQSI